MSNLDLEKARRESVRWYILRALEAGRPTTVSETTLARALADADLGLSPNEVRKQLVFLSDTGMVVVDDPGAAVWRARLTAFGVNVVEYDAPAPAGIGRPDKWF